MDGGGDRLRTVHFLLSQGNRRRVHNHHRFAISARLVAQSHDPRTSLGPVPDEDDVPEDPRLALILAELAEDSGFESGSEGD